MPKGRILKSAIESVAHLDAVWSAVLYAIVRNSFHGWAGAWRNITRKVHPGGREMRLIRAVVVGVVLVIFCCSVSCAKKPIPIGEIVQKTVSISTTNWSVCTPSPKGAIIDEDNPDLEVAFHAAINRENMYNANIEFVPTVLKVPIADSFVVEKKG